MADLVGHNLGNYRIVARLGRGGMGEVYRAVHTLLNRPAAIKVLHADQAVDSTFQARFLREARAAAALSHPNIVEVFDFGEQDDNSYLVMELVPDGSLRSLLRQRAKGDGWSLGLGVDLARQTAEGLAYAHAHGMVHRDIKPDNLLLQRLTPAADATGEERYLLKISDFGLARLMEDTTELTMTGVVMGTPAYMSPEQCQGGAIDGRSDLYSLGVVLYELATGAPPFRVRTLSEAVFKHISAPPIPPREVRPDLPVALEEVILRCLAKRPEDRFATGTELAAALEDSLTESALTTIVSPPGSERLTPSSPASGSSAVGASSSETSSSPSSAPTMQSEPSLAVSEPPAPATVAADATAPIDSAETQRAEMPAAANAIAPAASPATPTPPPARPATAAPKQPTPRTPPIAAKSSAPRTPPADRLSPVGPSVKPAPGAGSGANKKSSSGQNSQVGQARRSGQSRQNSAVGRTPARPQGAQQPRPTGQPAAVAAVAPVIVATPDKPAATPRAEQEPPPQRTPPAARAAAPVILLQPLPADGAANGRGAGMAGMAAGMLERLGPLGRRPLALGGIGVLALIIILVVALTLGSHHTPTAAISHTPTPTSHHSATATPQATATAAVQVVFQDSLAASDRKWFTSGNSYFANGGYTVQGYWITYAPTNNLSNVTISVRTRQISGPTDQFYGIVFRGGNGNTYYFFGVSANQQWTFSIGAPRNGKAIVAPTSNSHIAAGLGASNTLTVTAQGSHFVFTVNGVMVGQASDGTISSGTIALAVPVDHLTVVYNNFVVDVPA